MDGTKAVRLSRDRLRRTQARQDPARQQRRRSLELDCPHKSNLPGIPGRACFGCDPVPQRSASSLAPANQFARIARAGVFTQPGSIDISIAPNYVYSVRAEHWAGEPECQNSM